MSRFISLCASLLSLLPAIAQNPIISGQYTADPTARVFNGRMYLYPSHDIISPMEPEKKWFCMEDYHVFSSDNLTDWTDHGVILTQNKIPWVRKDSYAMWAPDCVERDGRYYFYFPASPAATGSRGFGIGVALANNPEGPFMPMWRPIKGVNGIDPCVLVDSKGKAYIYWQGMGLKVAPLNDDMMSLADSARQIKGLPKGFMEGPFAFERNGKYYLTFPWVRKKTETLAYAMSDNPMGPFDFKGVIMEESPTGCWTNHHSIVQYKGQWYLFYHHNDYSPDFDKLRSVRIDSLSFNADGTIQPVKATLRGVGTTPARGKIEIDRYSNIKGKAHIAFLDETARFNGWKTVFASHGAQVTYNSVDFTDKPVSEVTVRVKSSGAASMDIAADGKTIAVVNIPRCAQWTDVKVPIRQSPKGIAALTVSLTKGKKVEVDWIGFDMMPWKEGAFVTGKYRNFFGEIGYSQQDIDRKVEQTFNDLFYGKRRIYFEVGDSMGYISDVKNNDVRTEGMSYGMMAAVQFDKKDVFDRLWRWTKKYMQHKDGAEKGYFAWSCKTDGTRNANGSASDGELYFITSLIFASNQWGNDSGINYLAEAQHILDCSMQKVGMNRSAPLIDVNRKLITFTPDRFGSTFTDPSYHVPAFYEVWARWANDGRSAFWNECAKASREYLHRSVHPLTGLTPDYNNYDGTLLHRNMIIGDAFRFDSWRVPMNIALDYSWSCADREWQQEYANRIQSFFMSKGIDDFVDQYNIDGTAVKDTLDAGGYKKLRHSIGLVATTAAISIAATAPDCRAFVQRLWDSRHEPYSDGYFDAYYDGLLRLFAMMHLSGKYRVIEPRN